MTGAARGLGREIALDLGRHGYAVAVVDVDFDGCREYGEANRSVIEELAAAGVPVLATQASTTDAPAMQELLARIDAEWRTLDALVCNAGGGSGRFDENRASDIDFDALDLVLQRNLYGTIATVKTALPSLRRASDAAIVTMGSATGVLVNPAGSYAHYGVAKAAVMHYTRYLANDLASDGIRVNCLAPGIIATGRARLRLQEGATEDRPLLTPIGTPQDVAAAVRYLISPASSFVSGQVLQLWRPDASTARPVPPSRTETP